MSLPDPGTIPAAGRRPSALRHRDFRIFWAGAFLSNAGSWLQALTVPYVLFQLTGSAVWVGLATFAQFLPMVLGTPWGGTLADRKPRRSILLGTQSGMAATAFVLWGAWMLDLRAPLLMLGLVAVGGLLGGVNVAAWQSYLSDLVPREDLLSAITLNSTQYNAARAIGPAIAGIVLALWGPSWALFINVVSYGFVLAALLAVRNPGIPTVEHDGTGAINGFVQAMRYVAARPGLVLTVIVSLYFGFFGYSVIGLTVVFAGAIYLVGPLALGFLNVALGVGAIGAAPVVSGWRRPLPLSTMIRWGSILFGVGMLILGLFPWYAAGFVALVIIGGCALAVISSINTAVQLQVEERLRGRVVAMRVTVFFLTMPTGALAQGAAADAWGPRVTVAVAGTVMVACGAALGLLRGRYVLTALDAPGPTA